VVWVDPANIARNTLPPPVWIRSVSVDTKLYNDLETLEFPAHAQNIEINYTGAESVDSANACAFRYKLEGFDKDWRDAGVRRQAFYSKLPPRTYTFRVTASNNDGVWNEAGARFAFSISPSFTQSVLFKALCAITILGLSWLLYTIRLRQLTGEVRARLYERLAERTRIARELHRSAARSEVGLPAFKELVSPDFLSRSGVDSTLDRAILVRSASRSYRRALTSPVSWRNRMV